VAGGGGGGLNMTISNTSFFVSASIKRSSKHTVQVARTCGTDFSSKHLLGVCVPVDLSGRGLFLHEKVCQLSSAGVQDATLHLINSWN